MNLTPNPDLKMALDYFIFEEHSVSKGGFLPDFEKGAHACWYYCYCAHQNLQAVADGATLEGELDTLPALNNIAQSVALQYGFNDPSEYLVFLPVVLKEAERMGMGFDPRVLRPGDESFQHVI